ncbi:hypothetical protein SAICODRAFT_154123 [Saitoella complicata NRRL Y-17804]|uniref:uncharacterized protein n=1 Tax=Saitoella complicata (strain BCRC 22490 / CBS 7301 / JCM 7358 / NBRC 10748 / NRRL Y-17804) TaxID=698492 RepID=UPI0008671E11|nr:uncharacterized protein SAICODRAFT_154123 [Saitoella complicata NRRL Y-17804]ODQ51295.1 hypothetical protein SAICODRAFT_154123 [Saitoella complicata NRRL Y-17804]
MQGRSHLQNPSPLFIASAFLRGVAHISAVIVITVILTAHVAGDAVDKRWYEMSRTASLKHTARQGFARHFRSHQPLLTLHYTRSFQTLSTRRGTGPRTSLGRSAVKDVTSEDLA